MSKVKPKLLKLGNDAKEIIYKVYLYCELEASMFPAGNGYFQNVQKRTSIATGVPVLFINRLLREKGKCRRYDMTRFKNKTKAALDKGLQKTTNKLNKEATIIEVSDNDPEGTAPEITEKNNILHHTSTTKITVNNEPYVKITENNTHSKIINELNKPNLKRTLIKSSVNLPENAIKSLQDIVTTMQSRSTCKKDLEQNIFQTKIVAGKTGTIHDDVMSNTSSKPASRKQVQRIEGNIELKIITKPWNIKPIIITKPILKPYTGPGIKAAQTEPEKNPESEAIIPSSFAGIHAPIKYIKPDPDLLKSGITPIEFDEAVMIESTSDSDD